MRRILIAIAIVVVCVGAISISWLFNGRQLSLFVDRFGTIESASIPIQSLTYEGSGTGGTLLLNDLRLGLSPADSTSPEPNVGTTKDNELALSFGGKVFAFGPLRSADSDKLETEPQAGDKASISIRHSALCWVIPPDFKTGWPFTWRRQLYYQLVWRKQNGANLEMVWRYEQPFSRESNAWRPNEAMFTGEYSPGLVRMEIQP
jgi:hypothetical protein